MKTITVKYKRHVYTIYYSVFGQNSTHVDSITMDGHKLSRHPVRMFNKVRESIRAHLEKRQPVIMSDSTISGRSGNLAGYKI